MRKRPLVAVIVLAALVVAAVAMQGGCVEEGAVAELGVSAALMGDSERGRELMEEFECGRCHTRAARADEKSCSGCHASIVMASTDLDYLRLVPSDAPNLRQKVVEWAPRIVHFREVPSFIGVTKLFRREWLVRFLTEPHDLRPRLGETMPSLDMTEREAANIVAYLAVLDEIAQPAEPYFAFEGIAEYRLPFAPHEAGNRSRGERSFEELGCGTCHWFSGARERDAVQRNVIQTRALMMAPDLRYTRDRFQPLRLVPWLLEPTHHKKDAAMPQTPMGYPQARDLAAYIITQPLDELPAIGVPMRLPVLERQVRYDEVREQVFDAVCIHCHSDPDLERGDGGPGNAGGFGFEPRGLNLASYEAIFAGYLADDDKRHSVFELLDDGTPVIVAALLARQLEEAGQQGRVRGMPLALPSLSQEKIQLLETWIAQGRPR